MKVSKNQEIQFSGFWIGLFKECQKGPQNILKNVSCNYFFVEYAELWFAQKTKKPKTANLIDSKLKL